MGLIQPYVGKYVTATSASTKLDATSIFKGCNAVDEDAEGMSRLITLLKGAGISLNEKVLSINNQTVDGNIEECVTGIEEQKKVILNATDTIRSATEKAYNQLQKRFNDEARAKDRAIQEQKNRENQG